VGPEARPTQPPHPQRIADVPTSDPVDLELYGSPDTVNIEDILIVDVTPLLSISTSGPDMSVVESLSVDRGTLMSVDFDDRMREIQSVEIADADTAATVGARHSSGDPSLAPNVGRANLDESTPGTHPLTALGHANLRESPPGMHQLTAQGYTSLGDTASGMIPSMALGRYTDHDDIVQDRFWTNTVRRRHDVDSVSDLSIPEFDSRSEYDRYFAERDTRRENSDTVSASAQVTPHTWTPMVPDPSQLGQYLLSNIGTPPFKKPKTPPPRAVVTTTEMYMRHTSQDVVATAQRGHRRGLHPHPHLLVQGFLVHLRLLHGPVFNSGWMRLILRFLLHRRQSYLLHSQSPCTQVSLLPCHLSTLLLRWQPRGCVAHVKVRRHEGHALVTHRLRSFKG